MFWIGSLLLILLAGTAEAATLPAPIEADLQAGCALPATVLLSRELVHRAQTYGVTDPRTVDCLVPLGVLAEDADQEAEARLYLSTALEAYRDALPPDDPRIVGTLAQLARLWRGNRADYARRAHAVLEQGMRLLAASDSTRLRADLLHAQSNQLRLEGDLPGAQRVLARAVALRRRQGPDLRLADNLVWLAFIQMKQGEDARAERRLHDALRTLDELGYDPHPLRATALNFLAEIVRARGDLRRAQRLAERAVAQAESTRADQLPGMRYWGEPAAMTLADLELVRGDSERAIRRVLAVLGPHARLSYSQEQGRSRQRLARLERERAARQNEESLETRMRRLVEIIPLRAALYEKVSATPASLDPPVAPPNSAYVGWFSTFWRPAVGGETPRIWGYLIDDRGEIHTRELPTDGTAMDLLRRMRRLDEALREASTWPGWVASDDELDALSATLTRDLVDPLLAFAPRVEHLIVLPSPGLPALPLESLSDGAGGYLTDHVTVVHLPSLSMAHRDGTDRPPTSGDRRSWSVMAVGGATYDPDAPGDGAETIEPDTSVGDFGTVVGSAQMRSVLEGDEAAFGGLPSLPYSKEEARAVGHCFEHAVVLLGRDASESRLADMASSGRLRDFTVLHIASHALLDPKFPRRSALVLTNPRLDDDPSSDGLVTAEDIDLAWPLHAELLTLSACQTGARIWSVDGGSSFIVSALAAGARSVLASRWKVNDLASLVFMRRFYAEWTGADGSEPKDKSEALDAARTWLREYRDAEGRSVFAHPVYWSSFILFGDSH